MSVAPYLNFFGSHLTEVDYGNLAARWITREVADVAGLRRVDSYTGREMFARKTGDCSGIITPQRRHRPGDKEIHPAARATKPGVPAARATGYRVGGFLVTGDYYGGRV